MHAFWVSDLKTDFRDERSATVASELVGSSITSISGLTRDRREAIERENPHVRYSESERRGYVVVELSKSEARSELKAVEDVTDPNSGIETLASFVVEKFSVDGLENHTLDTLNLRREFLESMTDYS